MSKLYAQQEKYICKRQLNLNKYEYFDTKKEKYMQAFYKVLNLQILFIIFFLFIE